MSEPAGGPVAEKPARVRARDFRPALVVASVVLGPGSILTASRVGAAVVLLLAVRTGWKIAPELAANV